MTIDHPYRTSAYALTAGIKALRVLIIRQVATAGLHRVIARFDSVRFPPNRILFP